MDEFMQYVIELQQSLEGGLLGNFPEPDPPADLGDPLTQDEIDWIKTLKKEIETRFVSV